MHINDVEGLFGSKQVVNFRDERGNLPVVYLLDSSGPVAIDCCGEFLF